jgi:acyl-CoA thioesterase FadM
VTTERLDQLLAALHWNDRMLAADLEVHWVLVRQWRTDPSRIPPNVERWLEQIAEPLLAQPLPEGWSPHAE